jgi:uncharacterized RDD family membrane protein YckC
MDQPLQSTSFVSPIPAVEARYICGFWRRGFALLLDLGILFVVLAFPAIRWFGYFSYHPGWALVFGFIITFPYFIILNSRLGNGQTIGKKAMKIRVTNVKGETVSLPRSAFRFCVLAIPFFFDDVHFTCGGHACDLSYIGWLFIAWELAVVYLYIFNRRTRQSLHDLAARTYVIDAELWPSLKKEPSLLGEPPSRVSGTEVVTVQKVWVGHLWIVGTLLVIAILAGSLAERKIEEIGPFPELFAIRNAVLESEYVRDAGVTVSKNWTNGNNSTSVVVNVTPSGILNDDAREANEIAAIALRTSPEASQVNSLDIVIFHQVNFGFAHFSNKRFFRHTPKEWQQILGQAPISSVPTL